jgi:hypothetical protein
LEPLTTLSAHTQLPPAGDSSSRHESSAAAADEPRYKLRKRSQMKVPARYAVSGLPSSLTHSPGLFDIASHTHNLTHHLKPCATLRQPVSEVHFDEVAEYGFGSNVDNAIFSHAWAPDGRGVFTCGGPLAMGIRGCYMSMWT